ncbi:DUF421 domain-containing protein [Pseudonocardia bannensis]|uniref:DUF421 domain-containing protein n=1 Tax=Pseudonocardia bannensis TaxID=630973 RepID=A0A848DLT6_9PSEU|nr:YetF domain-containing protein [Pseudonocardia bannensis]NMH93401.1 DUF421 domain-containing protein [Pseudonocardia bannensis]
MEIVFRAALIYLFLFVITRALGKAALAQMNVFELLLLLVVADLVQSSIMQNDLSLTGGILAVSTFGLLTALMAWLQSRFPQARKLLEGQPVIVVRDGEMHRDAMKVERLPESDLLQAAREQGIRDLRDVELAVLEVDGKISFFLRRQAERAG